jgi:hypothetical protein
LDVVKLRFYGFDVNKSIDWSCTWMNMLYKICSVFLRKYQLPWGFQLWIQRSCHASLLQSNSMLRQPWRRGSLYFFFLSKKHVFIVLKMWFVLKCIIPLKKSHHTSKPNTL